MKFLLLQPLLILLIHGAFPASQKTQPHLPRYSPVVANGAGEKADATAGLKIPLLSSLYPALPTERKVVAAVSEVAQSTIAVPRNSVWKYHDRGQDLGTGWTAASYDAAAWASGTGVLGYGDPVSTALSFGPSSASKYPSSYFRHAFTVDDPAKYETITFNIRRDDGAVVYLNGVEQFRTGMPTGTVSYSTLAATTAGTNETTYFTFKVPAAHLLAGRNVLAVSVHQVNLGSSDLTFDLEAVLDLKSTTPTPEPCSSTTIGCFVSVKPAAQQEIFVFPKTHAFQLVAKSGVTAYTSGGTGTLQSNNDFTGFIAKSGSSKEGYLSINHENGPGGVSILQLRLDEQKMLWETNSVHKVDFSSVVKTDRNCSGGITPWGTVITSEETLSAADANGDGYYDVGWQVEIDPATGMVRDQDGDGKPDKLWALGRLTHENIAVGADGVTVYQGEDGGSGGVFKFVANRYGNLSAGTLYVLQRSSSNPSQGVWVQVPNTTASDRNNTSSLASSLGATNWSNVEDVEFGPDGKIYFTSKINGIIWRFKDNGSSVSEIEAWVTNRSYPITYEGGVQDENFGTGIDNLAFDGEGNLWALQDGNRNHLWVIPKDHTPANPKVELFATIPIGAEPTGLTFTPDYRYGFLSFQHPSGSNSLTQTDAAGNEVRYNAATTVVFARKEFLGQSGQVQIPVFDLGPDRTLCQGQSVTLTAYTGSDATVTWSTGAVSPTLTVSASGTYSATAATSDGSTYTDEVRVEVENVTVDLGPDQTICEGQPVTLTATASPGATVTWSNGAVGPSITVSTAGTYTATATSAAGCTATDAVTLEELTVSLGQESERSMCPGGSVTLAATASAGATVTWNTGAVGPTLTVTAPGIYTATATSSSGCTVSDQVMVIELTVDLGPDRTICQGQSVTLTASTGSDATVTWSTGAVGQTLTVTAPGIYTATATTTSGCTVTDEVKVDVVEVAVDLGPDRTLCKKCSIILDAGPGYSSYRWSTGATTRTIKVSNSGEYSVTVTNAMGCSASDEVAVVESKTASQAMVVAEPERESDQVQVYPNPFQYSTQVQLTLQESAKVTVDVYSADGKKVATLVNSTLSRGEHSFEFRPASGAARKLFLVSILVNGQLISKKVVQMGER